MMSEGALPTWFPWWLNYPGLEAWKFLNLILFLALMFYVLRRPLSAAFKGRRESIRRELVRAQEERDSALEKLTEVETRLKGLDAEVAAINERAVREAADERERMARDTDAEVKKLMDQARREIESAGKAARQDLRRYAAEETVVIARELIKREIRAEDDDRLIRLGMAELGGVSR
ncbi:MAG: F-type H+-transporting ATPase subunit b [Blastocatellia bacterium]|jgi:F0F1-type ATP synthase membrane subunit b/b'|nr:F-type H+-transporting ATPase subunit b [Blastocatellia bacterium]